MPTNKPVTGESVDKPVNVVAKPEAIIRTEQEAVRISLIDTMKAHYKNMPRRKVKIRHDADVPVQVNGYTFVIQHGVPVDVPEEIADILEAADYI